MDVSRNKTDIYDALTYLQLQSRCWQHWIGYYSPRYSGVTPRKRTCCILGSRHNPPLACNKGREEVLLASAFRLFGVRFHPLPANWMSGSPGLSCSEVLHSDVQLFTVLSGTPQNPPMVLHHFMTSPPDHDPRVWNDHDR